MAQVSSCKNFDRYKALKAFDETKAGVKGVADVGASKIPKIFIRPTEELLEEANCEKIQLEVPIIDLKGINDKDRRGDIVGEIKRASETWGFFMVVNHGVPLGLMADMIDGTRRFHEENAEIKKEFYRTDRINHVKYYSNVNLYDSKSADWRDTLAINFVRSYHIDPLDIPEACREVATEYVKELTKLGETMLELLSEALGLNSDHLSKMECGIGRALQCLYYPSCPEPELTMGTTRHTDTAFLNILLQDNSGGLQVRHNKKWADIKPIDGSFIVNIGDILQMLCNDKFFSAEHRVLAKREGPRCAVSFFLTGSLVNTTMYGPIKALLSEENPPRYKDFSIGEFEDKYYARPSLDISSTEAFKL